MLKRITVLLVFVVCWGTDLHAVQQCVYLPTNTDGVSYSSQDSVRFKSEWNVKFQWGSVRGIAGCSSAEGDNDAIGLVRDTIDNDAFTTEAHYCWCKMFYPAISKWVLVYHNGLCIQSCAHYCALVVAINSDVREAMFSTVMQY